jgi:hypothetical protein
LKRDPGEHRDQKEQPGDEKREDQTFQRAEKTPFEHLKPSD